MESTLYGLKSICVVICVRMCFTVHVCCNELIRQAETQRLIVNIVWDCMSPSAITRMSGWYCLCMLRASVHPSGYSYSSMCQSS